MCVCVVRGSVCVCVGTDSVCMCSNGECVCMCRSVCVCVGTGSVCVCVGTDGEILRKCSSGLEMGVRDGGARGRVLVVC